MEHEEINKSNLIDRYLMGKLLAEERADFEEHFIDCPQCIADLQMTKNFMQDLRSVSVEQVSQIEHHRPKSAFGHFLQILFRKPLAVALGCLLVAVAVSAFGVMTYMQRLRAEVNQARKLSEQIEQRYENELQAAEKRHQETELQQLGQLREMEARLKAEESRRTETAAAFGQRTRPEGSMSLFILRSVRDGSTNTPEAANPIIIPDSSAMFTFSVPLEGEQQFKNYHVKIFNNHNVLVWENPRLIPDLKLGSLFIGGFKRGFFQPGDYSLTVNGGGKVTFGSYQFSIIKAR